MNTCNTCRHWERPAWMFSLAPGKWTSFQSGGLCGSVMLFQTDNDQVTPDIYDDQNGLVAQKADEIWTGPLFGCVHWAERE